MDNEKENFKTELKESFNEISLPVHIPGRLKNILEEKKKENFVKFDGATKEVHQESEYKRNEKRELESFANEKIDEMMEKNGGISFFSYTIVCMFHLGKAVNTGSQFVQFQTNHYLKFTSCSSQTFALSNGRSFY